jgi:hypothetical protein
MRLAMGPFVFEFLYLSPVADPPQGAASPASARLSSVAPVGIPVLECAVDKRLPEGLE